MHPKLSRGINSLNWASMPENLSLGACEQQRQDQPAHPRSLISAFVIRFFKSIISKLATGEISLCWLVSVAEETGLKLALSETTKTGFLTTRPNFGLTFICFHTLCM